MRTNAFRRTPNDRLLLRARRGLQAISRDVTSDPTIIFVDVMPRIGIAARSPSGGLLPNDEIDVVVQHLQQPHKLVD